MNYWERVLTYRKKMVDKWEWCIEEICKKYPGTSVDLLKRLLLHVLVTEGDCNAVELFLDQFPEPNLKIILLIQTLIKKQIKNIRPRCYMEDWV